MAERANYLSMDIENQLPLETVAALRLLAGVSDDRDERRLDGLSDHDRDALYMRVIDHAFALTAVANEPEAEAEKDSA